MSNIQVGMDTDNDKNCPCEISFSSHQPSMELASIAEREDIVVEEDNDILMEGYAKVWEA